MSKTLHPEKPPHDISPHGMSDHRQEQETGRETKQTEPHEESLQGQSHVQTQVSVSRRAAYREPQAVIESALVKQYEEIFEIFKVH